MDDSLHPCEQKRGERRDKVSSENTERENGEKNMGEGFLSEMWVEEQNLKNEI